MRVWLLPLTPALVTVLACTLPLEEKSACDDSFDCLDGRACVEGQCTDDACGLACGALCETQSDCESARACEVTCDPAATDLAVLQPAECGVQYDRLAEGSCEHLGCFEGCVAACTRAADCALLDDLSLCTLWCQLDPAPCPEAAATCSAVDAGAVGCWSRGELSGC